MRVPVAVRPPVKRELHGIVTVDDYAWLRNRDDPEGLSYLAENEYSGRCHIAPVSTNKHDARSQLPVGSQ